MELAIAHGYRRATVKGYSANRDRERARSRGPVRSGRNDLAKLRADMGSWGGGVVSGASPDGPVH